MCSSDLGGGGRVAVYFQDNTSFTGFVSVAGGSGYLVGGQGTIYTNDLGPFDAIDLPLRSGTILAGDFLRWSGHVAGTHVNGPIQYLWDFGNERSSLLKDPGLVGFTIPGTNLVTFDVLDTLGRHDPSPATRLIVVVPATNPAPDLVVTNFAIPAQLAIGQQNQITYQVANAGDGSVAGGSWTDALYLSQKNYLDRTAQLLMATNMTGIALVPGQHYDKVMSFNMPNVAEGVYYLILSVNDNWDLLEKHRLNNEEAVLTTALIPSLTNNMNYASAFTQNGESQIYRIDVPEGQNLVITL